MRREKVIRGRFRRVGWAGALRGQEILARTLGRKTDKKALREALEKEDAYTLHRPIRRRFPRRRVVVGGPYDQWQVDLVDVSEYADENGGVRYLLCCLDAFHQICLGEDLEEQEGLGGGRGISRHPEWSPRGTSVCHERQRTGVPGQTLC